MFDGFVFSNLKNYDNIKYIYAMHIQYVICIMMQLYLIITVYNIHIIMHIPYIMKI